MQRAKWHLYTYAESGAAETIRLLEMAIERDPGFAAAHQWLAAAWIQLAFHSWRIEGRNPWQEMQRSAEQAYRLSSADPMSVIVYGFAQEYAGNLETALDLARRGLQMAPHDERALHLLGQVKFFLGKFDDAVGHLSNAWRRARHEPWRYHISTSIAFSHYLAGRYDASAAWAERTLQITDYPQNRAIYAATLAQLGRTDEAAHQVAELTASHPGLRASRLSRNARWARPEDIEHYHQGLVKAGLPD